LESILEVVAGDRERAPCISEAPSKVTIFMHPDGKHENQPRSRTWDGEQSAAADPSLLRRALLGRPPTAEVVQE
jgi:hypothetical protein